ncbi:RNA methyltransferase [Skermanella sp. TT6]|mgnify:CR=1 FL=1|uniref:tRNA (cytidine/uridine-2'-O-)-methyltransferase TrmJ n=1 Tax=Skermanella cutis TaxID=2775420 RepID=A0ABX7BBS5_9PROT|nr:RNA methyltransferase [Skermanella sp. TT6]QQP91844.1 RNA methyltransferase [Skermanella sp. TT6]
MAGTNPQRDAVLGGPAIILIEPQLGENIGTCARAMLNCGLTDLRLVRPRDGWPSGSAKASASGADLVLDNARLFDRTEDAIADLSHVFATTARNRGMIKRIMTPREAASEMRAQSSAGLATGVLFGPERTGLFNDDLALADTSLTVPLNPAFSSLNLAQAVLIIGYEWYQTGEVAPGRYLHTGATRPANKEELVNLFSHLEDELENSRFFSSPEKKPSMIRSIRNCFQRMDMTEQEVRTFHGIISALTGRKRSAAKE